MQLKEIGARLLSGKNERWTLIAISFCILVLQIVTMRSLIVVGEPYWISQNLLHGLGFSYIFPWDTVPTPTSYITPLYVYYLYGLFSIGVSIVWVQVSGLIFFHIGAQLLYYFFKRHLNRFSAFLGFLGLSLYVPLWLMSEKIDPDALNLMLVAITIFVLDGFRKDISFRRWILLGLLYGIQLLVRPDVLLGTVFFGIWLMMIVEDRTVFLKRYALSLVIMLIVVSPWTIRNYIVFDKFVLVSSNAGFNLYMGNNPTAKGEFQQAAPNAESLKLDSARTEFYKTHISSVDRDGYLLKDAIIWMKSHPMEVVMLDLKKFYFHWWQRESTGSDIQVARWMVVGYNIVTIFITIIGLLGLRLLNKQTRWLLITLFFYSTVIATVFFVQSRHRAIKVDPYLIMLTVAMLLRIVSKRYTSRPTISLQQ